MSLYELISDWSRWDRMGSAASSLWTWAVQVARNLTSKIASSITLILLWFLFLSLGHALKADDLVKDGHPSPGDFLLYLVSWTWTNVGVLACVAAMLGESVRPIKSDDRNDYRRALVYGFFAYLATTAGYMVGQGGLSLVDVPHDAAETFTSLPAWIKSKSQDTYTRVALTVTMAGFLAGYAPDYIARFLKALTTGLSNGEPNNHSNEGSNAPAAANGLVVK